MNAICCHSIELSILKLLGSMRQNGFQSQEYNLLGSQYSLSNHSTLKLELSDQKKRRKNNYLDRFYFIAQRWQADVILSIFMKI